MTFCARLLAAKKPSRLLAPKPVTFLRLINFVASCPVGSSICPEPRTNKVASYARSSGKRKQAAGAMGTYTQADQTRRPKAVSF